MAWMFWRWVVISKTEIARDGAVQLAMCLHHEYKHLLDVPAINKKRFELDALLYSFHRMQDEGYSFDEIWELERDSLLTRKYKTPAHKLKQWLREQLSK